MLNKFEISWAEKNMDMLEKILRRFENGLDVRSLKSFNDMPEFGFSEIVFLKLLF